MIYTYDVQQKGLRNFKASRAEAIEITDIPWSNQQFHMEQATDPFRIVDLNRTYVHLRFN